jgi:hypothetical protein
MKLNLYLGILLSLFTLTFCNTDVQFLNIIDKSKDFEIVGSKEKAIYRNSIKHKLLINWTERNSNNWTQTPITFLHNIAIEQNNFRLEYYSGKDKVVISFIDKTNKPRQFIKTVKAGELDFLFK